MALRLVLVFLTMALVMVAESTTLRSDDWNLVDLSLGSSLSSQCNGKVGDCIDVDEEMLTLDSATIKRVLRRRSRYISYGAMRANAVPCSNRGSSYYNCKKMTRANPYKRGCSAITRCKRFTR